MKRTRRQTIARGMSGRQRRRLARRLCDVRRGWGPGCFTYGLAEERDARRLQEAGLAIVVHARGGMIQRRQCELFATEEAALRRYPRWAIMRAR